MGNKVLKVNSWNEFIELAGRYDDTFYPWRDMPLLSLLSHVMGDKVSGDSRSWEVDYKCGHNLTFGGKNYVGPAARFEIVVVDKMEEGVLLDGGLMARLYIYKEDYFVDLFGEDVEGCVDNLPFTEEEARSLRDSYFHAPMQWQLLTNVAAALYKVVEYSQAEMDHFEYRVQYGYFTEVGLFDSREKLYSAIGELVGLPIYAVFHDYGRNRWSIQEVRDYANEADVLKNNWRGFTSLIGEFSSYVEAVSYIYEEGGEL